ncbi:EscV/YscV/HrcV family type III secretion system export apparatus protein [Candidatus Symbiopectobacterium sp. NZEC151]|uniref:EscV/YscV/HrcV family type III secretion system export apparatus protein n=3 Tax=unclassified Symbiopectobacterium TaxID=2794573 RepID=UPI0022280B91|nr:EscV/YscV/HrcV family type III secretion system export apparatus protein [Candidatus Symbiopectobacterium sp. NZEC151]MCW2477126.1 EscV/YscV/HrcV family type III secretion system export apparatus protein [Candidatus Symbiopectobacterium sp. NZEC151]
MIGFLNRVRNHPELFILILIVVIISMLVIPLPTYLVDFLIGLNIVLSILVFLASFYIDKILSFSTFPAVLLITTLFRLALSVSTSRLILNDADAGDIISTFGEFVIGESLVVGFVIFAIVTIVQFMVITKGAERVAEVAARFSLDGMPGKQMSIDADLRAGSIDAEDAMSRRSVVERESQLYGSFDGAMKFIKGDAIAGIIVIFINFIGGISVGVSINGMDMSTALSTYTMLTIGDGLVAQIPALLIAIGAGFIVTRVNGDGDNMGRTIVDQLFTNPSVLVIAAIIALGIGSLPGFPFSVFMILALLLAGLYGYQRWKNNKAQVDLEAAASHQRYEGDVLAEGESSLGIINNLNNVSAETVPLILVVNKSDEQILVKANITERFRSQFFIDYGINLPEITVRASEHIESETVSVLINEISAERFQIKFNQYRVVNGSEELLQLGIPVSTIENMQWIAEEQRDSVAALGYQLRSGIDEMYYTLAAVLIRHVNEYFGVQETKHILDKMEEKYPDLMKEVMRHATIQRISEVLQRLLSERISVRNMRLIMEALAQWAPREKEVISLVEHVRGALSRYICHKFSVGNSLRVIMLSAEFEDQIRQSIRNTSTGVFLHLEPAVADELIDRFALAMESVAMSCKDLVVLSSVDIRRFLKRFLESRFKDLEVMSFGEITDTVSINVVKTI